MDVWCLRNTFSSVFKENQHEPKNRIDQLLFSIICHLKLIAFIQYLIFKHPPSIPSLNIKYSILFSTICNYRNMNNGSSPFMDNSTFESFDQSTTRRLKHPVITFFHLIFRSLALLVYLLCGWYSNSFIGSFVSIILLLSLDFWTVKNITGKLDQISIDIHPH